MGFAFKPAMRENVGLILGMIGASGSGKTYSAMTLAKGLSAGKRFAVIDTENGRAKHYADQFEFDHGDLRAPFSPVGYQEAILAAAAAGYPAIVVDSFSHEHAGDGGLLDMHEAELTRMAGDNWGRRESCNMAAWIKPKQAHKAMVSKLLQIRAHLILCFRAEEKVEMVRGDDNKMKIVPKKSVTGADGWIPICEKTLPYEMTGSFLLTPARPGVPVPIKLQEQHRALVPLDKPITEDVAVNLAAWAAGGFDHGTALRKKGQEAAEEGTIRATEWWSSLTAAERKMLAGDRERFRKVAEEVDKQKADGKELFGGDAA